MTWLRKITTLIACPFSDELSLVASYASSGADALLLLLCSALPASALPDNAFSSLDSAVGLLRGLL
jgi:hypothetical protein